MPQAVPFKWLWIALGELGQKTLAGKSHNPRIIEYHATTKLKATSDETPWGSSFVNWCMRQADIKGTEDALAESWLAWGSSCKEVPGAVAILHSAGAVKANPKITGNQVGFLLGRTDTSYILLGGDQGGQVKVGAFSKSAWQLKGCRWPTPAQATSTSSNTLVNAAPETVPFKWLWIALGEMGQKSVAGETHNPRIIKYHAATTMKATSDETAWGSAFVSWCMAEAGVKGSESAIPQSWLAWGVSCRKTLGAIAVLQGPSAAHGKSDAGYKVGFLLGETGTDYVLLGGDQDGQVKVSNMSKSAWRLKGYRWPTPRPLNKDDSDVLALLHRLGYAAKAEGAAGATFQTAVDAFREVLEQRLSSLNQGEAAPPDIDLVMKALILWMDDRGNQWGEGSFDSKDLKLSAPAYATVPASQYKCNAYVAESIYLSMGKIFLVHSSSEQKGRYFPYQAREWGDAAEAIPNFRVVESVPAMGDIWSNGTHTGIYLGTYAGQRLYISARDDGNDVFGLKDKIQYAHGIQIKYLPVGGVYRRYTP